MGSISIISSLRRRAAAALFFLLAAAPATVAAQATGGAECRGTLYLTLDTGTMSQAEAVAAILARHGVKATFFLANEATARGDHALDPSWAEYWRARAKEGHAFGSHTWRHRYLRADVARTRSATRPMAARKPSSWTRPPSAARSTHRPVPSRP